MTDDPLGDALRRHHDDRIPVISRAEVETGAAGADPRRPSRRLVLVAAAAIVVLVVAGLTVRALTREADEDVTAGPGSDISAWCAALAAPARVGLPAVVFLAPDVASADVEDVGARLRSTPGVELVRYYDSAAAFAQAQVLFADQPTMLRLLREADVPTSFRVIATDDEVVDELVREASAWPGVQQVQPPLTAPPPGRDGSGEPGGSATGWFGDDRVIEQLDQLAAGGPAEIDTAAWGAVRATSPDDLVDVASALSPLLDVQRRAPVPTSADQLSVRSVLTAADERCDLRPRPPGGDGTTTTATTTSPP